MSTTTQHLHTTHTVQYNATTRTYDVINDASGTTVGTFTRQADADAHADAFDELDRAYARRIAGYRKVASEWHNGPASALYAFASTGSIVPGLEREIRECIAIEGAQSAVEWDRPRTFTQGTKLRNLLNHVIRETRGEATSDRYEITPEDLLNDAIRKTC